MCKVGEVITNLDMNDHLVMSNKKDQEDLTSIKEEDASRNVLRGTNIEH